MALSDWMVGALWLDLVYAYRIDERDRDSRGNVPSLRPVRSVQGQLGKKHDTDNYDAHSSPAGQSKQNNIFTSDKLEVPLGVDLRAQDVLKIVRSDGAVQWFKVAGAPKSRTILGYVKVYLTITPEPAVSASYWGE